MNEKDVVGIFKRKCEELGGNFEENSEFKLIQVYTCHLSSMEKGKEMIKFINNLEMPEDTSYLETEVSIDTGDGESLTFMRTQWRDLDHDDYFIRYRSKAFSARRLSPVELKEPEKIVHDKIREKLIYDMIKGKLPKGGSVSVEICPEEDYGEIIASFIPPKGCSIDPIVDEIVGRAEELSDKIKRSSPEKMGERIFIEL